MDEYLSKPLKQNHLIQTILKCATLGGALLEKGRDVRSSANEEHPQPLATNGALPSPSNALLRPPLEPRPFTTTGPISHGSLESPAIVTADSDDPLTRVSLLSTLFRANFLKMLFDRMLANCYAAPHARPQQLTPFQTGPKLVTNIQEHQTSFLF